MVKLRAADAAVLDVDAAACGRPSAEQLIRVMEHFCRVGQEKGHPIHARVYELGTRLQDNLAALVCKEEVQEEQSGRRQSLTQRKSDVLSTQICTGLQTIIEGLRLPLLLHAKSEQVKAALWGGIEEALYRLFLAEPLMTHYRQAAAAEEVFHQRIMSKFCKDLIYDWLT
jgi:hypothetical protein